MARIYDLVLDGNTRDIAVPDEIKNIGVSHDSGLVTFKFHVPFAGDDGNLAGNSFIYDINATLYVINAEKAAYCYILQPDGYDQVTNPDDAAVVGFTSINFSWTPGAEILNYPGTVTFALLITGKSSSDDTEAMEFNSHTASVQVEGGINIPEALRELRDSEQSVNSLNTGITRLNEQVKSLQSQVKTLQAKIDELEGSSSNSETSG